MLNEKAKRMSKIRNTITLILIIPTLLLLGLFVAAGINNGFDEAFNLVITAPRNLFCSIVSFCEPDDETTVVREDELWTRIYERALLDTGKYETRGNWLARRTTFFVTHSMRMQATVSVTMALNLGNIEPSDIVVDNDEQTVTITLPPAQPVECFLTDIVYSDRSCVGVCGELEQDLVAIAERDVYQSEELTVELVNAYERGKVALAALISPLAQDYELIFLQDEMPPAPIESSSCD